MRGAWRWYWRTLSSSWAKMTLPRRRRFVVMLAIAFTIPTGVAVAATLAPHARGPIIVGFVAFWLLANLVLTVMRVRRSRRRD
jgi:amino acid permease